MLKMSCYTFAKTVPSGVEKTRYVHFLSTVSRKTKDSGQSGVESRESGVESQESGVESRESGACLPAKAGRE